MRRRLRIAVIAPYPYPIREPFAGGLEAHVWHLCRQLRRRGHHVRLIAAPDSDEVDEHINLATTAWQPSAAARLDVSMPEGMFMSAHHAYLRVMLDLEERLGGEVDLVHNHSFHYLPVSMSPLLRVPMLTTLHTPPTPWLESAICSGAQQRPGFTRFAAVSSFTARSWRVLEELPDVVPNGIDVDRWPAGGGGPGAVWSGRIVPEKNPLDAILAARLAGVPLRLAGPIGDPVYFAQSVAPHLSASVQYVGHLSQRQLASLVGGAGAAVVTPDWDEPFGLVVAEALACGTPVVAYRRGGVAEVLGPPANGVLVPPGDVLALADALPRAMALSRDAIRSDARVRLSSENTCREYEQLYRRLLVGRPRPDVELPVGA